MEGRPVTDGVEVTRAEINACGSTIEGWIACYDGSEGVGHGREEALRQLVVNVATEGHL